ncbi:MAG: NADH-quinone oxidoreductase subunit J [Cytophagales bacterium]|nr:NADH-quinone oxidoreductase subunit J [Cytophagales bacterium]MDW8383698.1 NADH-quinone oxidoreductase subunit J [Flammeovirgaceae bacterium]
MVDIIFIAFVCLTAFAAFAIVLANQILQAAYWLLCTLLGIAGIFLFLGADFIAIAQVIAYVGGVLVLLLFGIMFVGADTATKRKTGRFSGLALASGLLLFLIWLVRLIPLCESEFYINTTLYDIGYQLLTNFLVPFEIAGILLLVALVSAVFISAKK